MSGRLFIILILIVPNSVQLEMQQASIIYANEADVLNVAMFLEMVRRKCKANPTIRLKNEIFSIFDVIIY